MCLVVSGENNLFIAKKDIIVYKRLKRSRHGYVTPYQNIPVKLNSELIPEGKIELWNYGSKKGLDEGAIHACTVIYNNNSNIYFEAIIKKGTKFWIQDNLTQVAAEKLYLTNKKVFVDNYKPTDFSDYLEKGVDVYLKDGKRCKLTDSFDKNDIIGVYGYDNQIIALEYKLLKLLRNTLSITNGFKKIEFESDNIVDKLEKDLDGYNNTKHLKSLGIKSEALNYCEELGKDWYIPSSGELKKLFKNQLGINITLQYLGKEQLLFTWFWSSTLESSKCAWNCCSDGGFDWHGDFGHDYVGYCHYVLPFLKLS